MDPNSSVIKRLWCNLLSFDRLILEITDKVHMDEVLNQIETCPYQVILELLTFVS